MPPISNTKPSVRTGSKTAAAGSGNGRDDREESQVKIKTRISLNKDLAESYNEDGPPKPGEMKDAVARLTEAIALSQKLSADLRKGLPQGFPKHTRAASKLLKHLEESSTGLKWHLNDVGHLMSEALWMDLARHLEDCGKSIMNEGSRGDLDSLAVLKGIIDDAANKDTSDTFPASDKASGRSIQTTPTMNLSEDRSAKAAERESLLREILDQYGDPSEPGFRGILDDVYIDLVKSVSVSGVSPDKLREELELLVEDYKWTLREPSGRGNR